MPDQSEVLTCFIILLFVAYCAAGMAARVSQSSEQRHGYRATSSQGWNLAEVFLDISCSGFALDGVLERLCFRPLMCRAWFLLVPCPWQPDCFARLNLIVDAIIYDDALLLGRGTGV